ncbi:HAD-IB family hydrolase [Rouxiella badensis]|uniref:HAD family hydrolase n=1 Tax=Rouxiella badensis TaxID=1646377 RepID=UPI001D137881|nr:HAD-IB family hydrolase [Rouxiella badensis]MCC3736013.1 HAD-IB family hydrolase [Rouxiella badensis]MCC3761410.1 HAD-IB family hydrolase [Rouxiella badensis]
MSIAFFDFDETVITGKSMFIFLKKYTEYKQLKCGLSYLEILDEIQKLTSAGKTREYVNRYYYSLFKNEEQDRFRYIAENIFNEGCYNFNVEAVKKIRFHQSRGDNVIFVSGAMTDIIYPVMKALEIKESLCSEPSIVNGIYTGQMSRVSIGYHKAEHARNYALKHNKQLASCYAYGDHITDLDLLRLVGHPCAVNPSPELMDESQRQGWPVLLSQYSSHL